MDYLYQLQLLRESLPEFVTTFMLIVSHMAYYGGPVLMGMIFWGIDKKLGYDLVFTITASNLSCSVIKAGAQIQRPWFSDSRLHVAEAAAHSASGYSFPSGHSTFAMACYGTLSVAVKKAWFRILMLFMIVLTMFSRLFLGAHTIEDVAMGVTQSLVMMVLVYILLYFFRRHPELDWVALLGGLVICAASTLLIYLQTYTGDEIEIKKMFKDGMSAVGMFSGALIGWFVEKRFIRFENAFDMKGRILRIVGGLVAFALYFLVISEKIFGSLLDLDNSTAGEMGFGGFLQFFTTMLLALIIIPAFIKMIQKKRLRKKSGEA